MKLQPPKALCVFIIAVGILNFVAYGVAATCLGGDAINGRAENGHYFFSSHGKQTEVSEAVFNYSPDPYVCCLDNAPARNIIWMDFILSGSQKPRRNGPRLEI